MPAIIYNIDTEVSSIDLADLLSFIQQYYVLPNPEFLRYSSKGRVGDVNVLSFRAVDPQGL